MPRVAIIGSGLVGRAWAMVLATAYFNASLVAFRYCQTSDSPLNSTVDAPRARTTGSSAGDVVASPSQSRMTSTTFAGSGAYLDARSSIEPTA